MANFVRSTYIPPRMDSNNNNFNGLNEAFLAILKPVAKLFLHFDRGFREFSELAKTAFVVVASDEYGVGGRPTTGSRVSAMTGISRKEISRIRDKTRAGCVAVVDSRTPVQSVINAWRRCPEFVDETGSPRVLPLTGTRGSFLRLVRQSAGDIPEGAVRKELLRIGAIETDGSRVRLQPPAPDRAAKEQCMAVKLKSGPYPLLTALAATEGCNTDQESWPRATISCSRVRSSEVGQVREHVAQRMRLASRQLNDLLKAYEVQNGGVPPDEPTVPICAGVFVAETPAS